MDAGNNIYSWVSANLALTGMFGLFIVALVLVARRELRPTSTVDASWHSPFIIRFILPAAFWGLFFFALIPVFKTSGNFGPSFLEYNIFMPIITGAIIFFTSVAMHWVFSTKQKGPVERFLYWLLCVASFLLLVVFPSLAILDSVSSDRNVAASAGSIWQWTNNSVNALVAGWPNASDQDARFFIRGVLPFLMAFVIAIYISLDRFIVELDMEQRLLELMNPKSPENGKDWDDVLRTIILLVAIIGIAMFSILYFDRPFVLAHEKLGSAMGQNHVVFLLSQMHISTAVILLSIVALFFLFYRGVITVCARCTAKVSLGALAALLVGRSGDQERDETSGHGMVALAILFLTFTTFILEHDQRFYKETFATQNSAATLTGTAKVLYAFDEVVAALGGDVFDVYNLSVPVIFNIPAEYLTTDPDLIELGFDFSEVTHQPKNFFLSLFVLAFRTALVGALLVTILGPTALASTNRRSVKH